MKKIMMLGIAATLCVGCYIPHPASGVRTLQPYERYDEVCMTKVNKKGEKKRTCRWVRSR